MNRRIIWGVLFLLTLLTFYAWIPAGLYLSRPLLIALIGGALCFIFLMQTFADFRDLEEITQWNEYPKEWYHNMGYVCFPLAIALIFIFTNHYSKLEEEELNQFAEIVPATIVDGYSEIRSRNGTVRGSSFNLTIAYYTKKGVHIRTQKTVNRYEYDLAEKVQHIQVAYSSKHPTLSKILLGDEMIEEFTGITSRDITIGDMMRLLDTSRDSILPALNNISYRWTKINDSLYGNELKQIYIGVTPHRRVTYANVIANGSSLVGSVERAGFKKERVDTSSSVKGDHMILYSNGDLKMMVQTKTIKHEKYKNTDERLATLAEALNKEKISLVTIFRH